MSYFLHVEADKSQVLNMMKGECDVADISIGS